MTRPNPSAPPQIGMWVRRRMLAVGVLCSVAFMGIGYSAYGLQVRDVDRYRELAARQHVRTVEVAAPRGTIVDRVGRELAVTADLESIAADPALVEDVVGTSQRLAELLGLDVRTVETKLASRRRFVWIRRHVGPEIAKAVRKLDLSGVRIELEPRRFYPGRRIAGPILGFSDIDGRGIEGVELAMNDLLTGTKSKRAAVRDATGRLMFRSDEGDIEATPGATVALTVDRFIQFTAERALQRAVTEHKAKAGTIVVLDVASSKVLALASWPTFDPNHPSDRKGARNRAVTDAFEIGSVMKTFTIAAALEAGVVEPTTLFDIDNGRIRVGRKVIRDSYHDKVLDVAGILKRSSNVGTIKIARRLGKDALHEALHRYQFAARTGIELPGEQKGLIHPTKRWGETGLAAVSYGYMMMATPLQVAAGYAAIGNGGMYNAPRVIDRVVDHSGETLFSQNVEPIRIMKEKVAHMMLPMLAGVFDRGKHGGTARSVVVDGYTAGGKTGTSHKVDPATKRYSKELYLSAFAGLAPIKDPRIAVVVVIDEPHGEHHYGGKVAGPAWSSVVSETLKYLGVPSDKPAADTEVDPAPVAENRDSGPEAESTREPLEVPRVASPDSIIIPDFRGLSLRQVLAASAKVGVPVTTEGWGVAVRQHPEPGPAAPGTECNVVFGPK